MVSIFASLSFLLSTFPLVISATREDNPSAFSALTTYSFDPTALKHHARAEALQYSPSCPGAGLMWESPGNCNVDTSICQTCSDPTVLAFCDDTSVSLMCENTSLLNNYYFTITSDNAMNCVDDSNGTQPLRMAPCGGENRNNQFFSFGLHTGQIWGYQYVNAPSYCIDVGDLSAGILYKPCEDITSSAISNQIFVQEDNGLFQAVAKQQCLKRFPINSSLSLAPCNASDPLEQFTTYADCFPGSYSPRPN